MREEEAGGAAVLADRVVEVGQVEDGNALDLEDRVLGHDLVVDLDARARGAMKFQRGLGWAHEVNLPALHAVGLLVHPLDPPALHEDAGLHVADGVRRRRRGPVSSISSRSPESRSSPRMKTTLPSATIRRFTRAVGLGVLVDVRPVGLDAHAGHAHVHEPPRLEAALGDLLVGLRPDAHLARRSSVGSSESAGAAFFGEPPPSGRRAWASAAAHRARSEAGRGARSGRDRDTARFPGAAGAVLEGRHAHHVEAAVHVDRPPR